MFSREASNVAEAFPVETNHWFQTFSFSLKRYMYLPEIFSREAPSTVEAFLVDTTHLFLHSLPIFLLQNVFSLFSGILFLLKKGSWPEVDGVGRGTGRL